MATKLPNGMVRMDINDPQDVQVLVNSGLAWRSGPKDLQTIFRFITDGEVTRNPAKEPPEVTAYLDKLAPVEEQPGMPEEAEPVEEPGETEDISAPDA